MANHVTVLVVLASTVLPGCDVHTSRGERNPVDYDIRSAADDLKLRRAVASADDVRKILSMKARQMIAALNELGVQDVDDSAVRILVVAWQGTRDEEPGLNWEEMDRLDVRFALASELVRSFVNGATDVPVDSIAQFGRAQLSLQSDEGTLNRAMYLVVMAGNSSDIENVKGILLETSSQTTFRAGVSALASTCSSDAAAAIDQIRNHPISQTYKTIVDEVSTRSAAFHAKRCAAR